MSGWIRIRIKIRILARLDEYQPSLKSFTEYADIFLIDRFSENGWLKGIEPGNCRPRAFTTTPTTPTTPHHTTPHHTTPHHTTWLRYKTSSVKSKLNFLNCNPNILNYNPIIVKYDCRRALTIQATRMISKSSASLDEKWKRFSGKKSLNGNEFRWRSTSTST